MKIQILKTTNIGDCIDGYTPVFVENGIINVDAPNNSISSILMNNSIEEVPYEMIDSFIQKISQLLRLGGELVISGIEINSLCRDVINKVIDCKTLNHVLYNRKSIHDINELHSKLSKCGITITKTVFKGSTYEIHSTRQV